MIIVAGTLDFKPDVIDKLLAECQPLIEGAIKDEAGCLSYDWCPNPIKPGQILVYERWTDEAALQAHFDCHWYKDMAAILHSYEILDADVLKYETTLYEPVYDESGTPRADFFTRS